MRHGKTERGVKWKVGFRRCFQIGGNAIGVSAGESGSNRRAPKAFALDGGGTSRDVKIPMGFRWMMLVASPAVNEGAAERRSGRRYPWPRLLYFLHKRKMSIARRPPNCCGLAIFRHEASALGTVAIIDHAEKP